MRFTVFTKCNSWLERVRYRYYCSNTGDSGPTNAPSREGLATRQINNQKLMNNASTTHPSYAINTDR
jgi:hypothetical protein